MSPSNQRSSRPRNGGYPAPRGRTGFTLVETMVALAITGVLSISLVQMVQVAQRSSDHNKVVVEMQQNARVGLQSLTDDLRHVSYGKDATQPSIDYAGPDSVVFIADIMPDHVGAERISFFLSPAGDADTDNPDDTVLMRVVTDTAGVALVSAPQAYGIAQGGLSFRWFNGGGVELANPVPQPEQIGEIFTSLTAVASKEIGGEYPSLALTSTVYPRNLPLSPARSRPNAPGCGGLTFPDCESATLTWTTPNHNTDGTTLPLVDISHFCIYFGTDPDDLALYTKLARTINQWTVNGLADGEVYYLSVTCVSRSGVESYPCGSSADMTSPLVPRAPASLSVSAFPGGGGLHPGLQLTWGAVTSFTAGGVITTPVSYNIHRSNTPGFVPDDANRIATVRQTTTFVDSTVANCSAPHYKVCAKACGNPGAPSPEAIGNYPAAPSCPTALAGAPGDQSGEVDLTWTRPATRMDNAPLNPADIQGYRVYVDTLQGNTTHYVVLNGSVTSTTVTDLIPCKTYYFNLQCVDNCGHPGDFIPSAGIPVLTIAACDAVAPDRPATLALTPSDNIIDLQWPAPASLCDIASYRIYYGGTAGGPYNGTGADQGPSPILVNAASVIVGNVCRYRLSGLSTCQGYYVTVTGIDHCTPSHESASSPEAYAQTTCVSCNTDDACIAWGVDGASNINVNLELFTTHAGGETVTRVTPTFSGTARVVELWYGNPLVKIWASNGSAGQDGNIGSQPSGAVLNVTDFTIPATSNSHDGEPFKAVFQSDMRNIPIDFVFRGNSGTCTASGTGAGVSLIDDFNDGNYTGWTVVSGSWAATSFYAWESSTSSNYVLKYTTLTLGTLTYEAKIQASGGTEHSAYLVFRYQDSNNYYICGIRTDTDRLQVGRVQSGNWVTTPGTYTATLSDAVWYTVRVVVVGSRIRVWLNCLPVIDVTDGTMWATGGVGFSTRKARGGIDDIKIFPAAVLP